MIDPNYYLREATQNLEKWKDRYSEKEYPEKILLNLFYKKYATLEMWATFKSYFKKPLFGSRKVFWTQFEEGYNQLRELHRNTARNKVNSVLENKLEFEKEKVIGTIKYADFLPLLHGAKQGNANKIKEIEIAYLTHYLADECILLWSVLGGKGLSETDAFNKLCSTSLKSIKLNTYEEAEKEFIKFWVEPTGIKSSKLLKPKPKAPEHSISPNIVEVFALCDIIQSCNSLSSLSVVYSKHGTYPHPQINYYFGVSYLIHGDKELAKANFIKGAMHGISFPSPFYDTPFIDSVGQSLTLLLTNFDTEHSNVSAKVTALAYVYLSRCIELYPRKSEDSYRTRAILLMHHLNPITIQNFIFSHAGIGVLIEPYLISDYYFASKATNSQHTSCLESANNIHVELEDISIAGKDADQFTLEEMALLGEQRHSILFKQIESKYKKGLINISKDELYELFNYSENNTLNTNPSSMQQLLEKLSEVVEKSYAKVSAEARNKAYLDISLGLMTQINGILQSNLKNWPLEQTRLYGQRVLYCNHIHTAIRSYIDGSLEREDLQLAINSITLLYKSTLEEQQPNLDPGNPVLYKRVVEGMLLPQFLILRYLNRIYDEIF